MTDKQVLHRPRQMLGRRRGGDGKLPSLFDAFNAERSCSQIVSHWRDYISIIRFHDQLIWEIQIKKGGV